MRTVLIAVEMLAASTWVGSLMCLALVSSVAREVLDPTSRIELFRGIGRFYGIVGTGALVVAIGIGIAIAGRPSHWTGTVTGTLLLALVLVAVTGLGMMQARRMTRRRRQAIDAPGDEALLRMIRRGAAMAGALRGSIALLTLIVLVLGAHLIDG
jgi:putative copper export protein